jgi:hypothetical protein
MATKKCPVCNEDNREDAILCRYCGNILGVLGIPKKCPTCNISFVGEEIMCEACRSKLANSHMMYFGIAVVLAICILVLEFLAWFWLVK